MASSHSTRNVVVVIGTGRMGLAVTPRLAPGKHVLLADFQETTLNNALSTLREEGISCEGHSVNIAHYPSVEAFAHAAHSASRINAIIHTAGLSLGSASAKGIYAVDLIGTANIIEASCLLRPREPPWFALLVWPAISSLFSLVWSATLLPHLSRDFWIMKD